tara:strand:- start:1733 stop:2290 length:558 start_codon:yes stop_codon:yes gene_type:complete
MCLFAAAAGAGMSTVLSVAGTAINFIGQQQEARAQDRMNRQRQQLGTQRALENYKLQTSQAYRRLSQEREAAANEIGEVARQSRRAQAVGVVSAGEAGVTGKSVNAMLDDFERQELFYQTKVRRELEFKEGNITDQLEAIRIGTQGRIENLQFMPAQRPSFLGAALRIGGTIADYYADIPNPDEQ